MATIAETFLEDLEDSEDEEFQEVQPKDERDVNERVDDVEVVEIDIDSDFSDIAEDELPEVDSMSQLLEDERLTSHMAKIREVVGKTKKRTQSDTPLALDEEHEIIVRSNELILEIDHHIYLVHQFVVDIYSKKLPELANMVPTPIDYAHCVQLIGDRSSEELDSLPLKRVLTKKVALMVQITATTTLGRPLGESELERCLGGVNYLIKLEETKQEMITYINSRMDIIAPNVSAVVGSEVASQLISLAGGIERLSSIPACNIQVLGANKNLVKTSFAHHGVLVNSELVQMCPSDLTNRALRLLSNKVALAARLDANRCGSCDHGQMWYDQCKKKIGKWTEAPPQKPPKPLPIPDKNKARKRGGKRFRRMREKYTPTETQRMVNRMGFNLAEEEIITGDGEIVSLGMLGKHNLIAGAIRTHAKPNAKKSKLFKLNHRMIAKQKRQRQRIQQRGTQSGLTTNMVFTSVSGLELGDPENLRKKAVTKYFSKHDSFAAKSGPKQN